MSTQIQTRRVDIDGTYDVLVTEGGTLQKGVPAGNVKLRPVPSGSVRLLATTATGARDILDVTHDKAARHIAKAVSEALGDIVAGMGTTPDMQSLKEAQVARLAHAVQAYWGVMFKNYGDNALKATRDVVMVGLREWMRQLPYQQGLVSAATEATSTVERRKVYQLVMRLMQRCMAQLMSTGV